VTTEDLSVEELYLIYCISPLRGIIRVFQSKVLLPSPINFSSLRKTSSKHSLTKKKKKKKNKKKNIKIFNLEAKSQKTQHQSPAGTLDNPLTKRQTSTEQFERIKNK